ncbi:MAG: DUF6036 family nucleotidyltransferase [Firmicutes bacterium]|nr:DUF6036 family nucleotidyltransferase [Bacillota bacterium]
MSSEQNAEFIRENIDIYLKEVAKEYRKQVGKRMPAKLILIGGSSVLLNYGFRNMTSDIDAVILAASSMKNAINKVGDHFGLPDESQSFIENVMATGNNVDKIAENLQKEADKATVLAELRRRKKHL